MLLGIVTVLWAIQRPQLDTYSLAHRFASAGWSKGSEVFLEYDIVDAAWLEEPIVYGEKSYQEVFLHHGDETNPFKSCLADLRNLQTHHLCRSGLQPQLKTQKLTT